MLVAPKNSNWDKRRIQEWRKSHVLATNVPSLTVINVNKSVLGIIPDRKANNGHSRKFNLVFNTPQVERYGYGVRNYA